MDIVIELIKKGFYFTVDNNNNIKYEYIRPGGLSPPLPNEVKPLFDEIKANRDKAVPFIKQLLRYTVKNAIDKDNLINTLLKKQEEERVQWIQVYVKRDLSMIDFIGIYKEGQHGT